MSKIGRGLKTNFIRTDRNTVCGWVYDKADVTRKFSIELLVDGEVVAVALGDEPVAKLFEEGVGDGRFGFTFNIPEETIANCAVIEARLANLGIPIGAPILCNEISGSPGNQIGDLWWVGGLRFEGWIAAENAQAVEVLVSQQPVMTVIPTGWTHVQKGDTYGAARRLEVCLPEQFADGRVRLLAARISSDRSITALPVAFVAFDGGLERTLAELGRWDSERLRGQLFDRLIPASLPFSAYDEWKKRFPADKPSKNSMEAAVIFVGDERVGESIDSLETETNIDWAAVSLPTGESVSRFDRSSALKFLRGDAATSDFVVFCMSGTVFVPDALARLAKVFEIYPDCRCVYPDVDVQTENGAVWPLAFPAFDHERSLEQGYGAMLFAVSRTQAIDALRSASSLYQLFHASCLGARAGVYHVPGALGAVPQIDRAAAAQELGEATRLHLARLGITTVVEVRSATAFPAVRIRREISQDQRTTIIIPTRNRVQLLKRCLDSIRPAVHKARANILIVDNDSTDPETIEFLAAAPSQGVAVLQVSGPFNFSRLNNLAVRQSEADNVCLLNNDIEATDDTWLSEMLSRLADAEVGAVGAKLIWPSGVIQHGGVVLGVNFAACHAFNDRMDGDPGYGGLLEVAHECSAVTAACLLLRKRDYLAVEGLDEIRFPINFNDVDLCLKLRQLGKRIVFTPDARLVHLESASRGRDDAPDRKARFDRELRMLRSKWGEELIEDPYYNPMLGLDSTPFSALAWPLRSWEARTNRVPRPVLPPPGF